MCLKMVDAAMLFLYGMLLITAVSSDPRTFDELSPEAKAYYRDIFGDLDVEVVRQEVFGVPKSPAAQLPDKDRKSETKVSPTEKPSSKLELCADLLAIKDRLSKLPEFREIESKVLSYMNEVKSTLEKNPNKKDEIILHAIVKVIDLFEKLKTIYQEKSARSTVVRKGKIIVKKVVAQPIEEIIAEDVDDSLLIGSVRGIPGINFPNYTEVPITSFSCGDKKYIPGFYADEETRCQVFHVCYKHRRESFLCPVGTTFNQPILACDYWYNSNCSLSSLYYDVNAKEIQDVKVPEKSKDDIKTIITTLIEKEEPFPHVHVKTKDAGFLKHELDQLLRFLPIKAKILEFPKKDEVKPAVVKPTIAKPIPVGKVVKVAPIVKATIAMALPALKAGIVKGAAASAIPVLKAGIVKGAAVPVKAKVLAIPAIKAKVSGAMKVPLLKTAAAVPVVKAKVAAPVVAAKIAAKMVPLAKAAVKPKLAAIPLMKAKSVLVAAPLIKTKAVMISPLTKKALALGYVKLLKAKKLAMMG